MRASELVNGLMSRLDDLQTQVSQLTNAGGTEKYSPVEIGPELWDDEAWLGLSLNQRRFLACLINPESRGMITRAALMAKLTPYAHYRWMEKSTDQEPDAYRKAVLLAKDLYAQMLLDAAVQRAVRGVDEPVYHMGIVCGYKRRFSDNLLSKLLEAAMPGQFRSKAENEGAWAAVKVVELQSREETP